MNDETILVTGATDGLGRATARAAAERGAIVLVHGRNREKGERTVRELSERSGNERTRLYLADFASLAEVERVAAAVERDHERLDVLVNNAGVGGLGARETSVDGYELHFAVNHLAHFLLTKLLLPLLRRSAPSRIVNVASGAQTPIDFDDLMLERGYGAMRAYAQSKLAQVMFTFELAERLRAEGEEAVTVNAVHPASLMDTKLVRDWIGSARSSVEEGVDAVLRLALAPGLAGTSGRYFEGLAERLAHAQAYDPKARRRLWEVSEELVERRARRR